MAQIRMLKTFKGYGEDTLQDFGATENARLVSIGYASNDLDGPDGESVQNTANLAAELAALGVPVPIWQCGLPFVLFAGNGGATGLSFSGTRGVFTLSASIMTGAVLPVGFGYLPANAGGLGNSAGWFAFTMSSETGGEFYNTGYSPSGVANPTFPTTLTAFPNATPGRITQSTNEVTIAEVTIPAGALGRSGSIMATYKIIGEASSIAKEFFIRASVTQLLRWKSSTASNVQWQYFMQNCGAYNVQVATRIYNQLGGSAASAISGDYTAVDFSVAVPIALTMQTPDNAASLAVYPSIIDMRYGA